MRNEQSQASVAFGPQGRRLEGDAASGRSKCPPPHVKGGVAAKRMFKRGNGLLRLFLPVAKKLAAATSRPSFLPNLRGQPTALWLSSLAFCGTIHGHELTGREMREKEREYSRLGLVIGSRGPLSRLASLQILFIHGP